MSWSININASTRWLSIELALSKSKRSNRPQFMTSSTLHSYSVSARTVIFWPLTKLGQPQATQSLLVAWTRAMTLTPTQMKKMGLLHRPKTKIWWTKLMLQRDQPSVASLTPNASRLNSSDSKQSVRKRCGNLKKNGGCREISKQLREVSQLQRSKRRSRSRRRDTWQLWRFLWARKVLASQSQTSRIFAVVEHSARIWTALRTTKGRFGPKTCSSVQITVNSTKILVVTSVPYATFSTASVCSSDTTFS